MGGGFVSAVTPKRHVLPILGTFSVTLVPAAIAVVVLAALYVRLDELFPDAWSLENQVNVITLDRTFPAIAYSKTHYLLFTSYKVLHIG